MLIMTLPSACSFLGIGCPKPLSYFDIDGIALSNLEFTNTGLNPWKIVENNKSIRWDTYLLRVDFKATYYAENKKSRADLYALSCVEDGYLGSKTGVDTIVFHNPDRLSQHLPEKLHTQQCSRVKLLDI